MLAVLLAVLLTVLLLAVALLTLARLAVALLAVVVRPVADDRRLGIVVALRAALVLMTVFGSPGSVLAGFVLWIRRLSGAHRVTSLRLRMWHVSGHMPVLPNVST